MRDARRQQAAEGAAQRLLPLFGPHTRCIAAKRADADAGESLFSRLAGPPAAELDGVAVREPCCCEGLFERRAVELRVPSRGGKSPHVDERLDPYLAEAREQFLNRASPVADGEDTDEE